MKKFMSAFKVFLKKFAAALKAAIRRFVAAARLAIKRYTPVTMAAVRPILWKLLLIIGIMAVCELGLSAWQWKRLVPDYGPVLAFSELIYKPLFRVIYSMALTALTAVILLQGNWLSAGKPGYGMRRMPVSEGITALLWTGVYFGAYLILRAAQIVVVFGIWKLFADGETFHLVMDFYTDSFLHGLFPMENLVRHIRNLVWTLSMSAVLSGAAYARRRGVNQIGPFLLLAVELAAMGGGIDLLPLEISMIAVTALIAGFSVFNARGSRHEET